jgi:hypothetical protein
MSNRHEPALSGRHVHLPMPSFTRVTWVSARARVAWEPRFGAIAAAWSQIERHSVVAGLRRAAIAAVAAEDFDERAAEWQADGFSVLPIELRVKANGYASRHAPQPGTGPLEFEVALVAQAALDDFRVAWERQDQLAIADMLGYPRCCALAFRARYERHGMRDPTWPMAVATRTSRREASHMVVVEDMLETNILLRWLRARAVPHLPCRFDCPESAALGRAMIDLGRRSGHGPVIDWLEQVLTWPLEWSALHGLAEIRTPVCRVVADTDFSRARHVVRFAGPGWPEEGGQGLDFPYRNVRPDRLTGSTGFKRGLQRKA